MPSAPVLEPVSPQSWTPQHRQSHFAPAFFFLSKKRRAALATLYAVCRVLDDAVDVGREDPAGFLAAWHTVFSTKTPDAVRPFGQGALAESFLEVAQEFGIPMNAMLDLIDKGVSVDLKAQEFQTAMDTEAYCYGVASTVGLACLPIFGVPEEEGKNFAVRLGIAVQWTNILRDVAVDAKMGRIYLPLEHLELFGYTKEDLFGLKNRAEFKALMKHEAGVAESHYKRALDLLPVERKRELLPARIMGSIYRDLLKKLEANDFEVFQKKIRLNFWEKMRATFKAIRE